MFLGASTPSKILELTNTLIKGGKSRDVLEENGFRNALQDLKALGVISSSEDGEITITDLDIDLHVEDQLKSHVLRQPTIKIIGEHFEKDKDFISDRIKDTIGHDWKDASKQRNVGALKRFYSWAIK
jgi:hypothetical protein